MSTSDRMDAVAPNFPMVLAFAAPVFVALLAVEWALVARQKIGGRYEKKDAISSMTMGFGQLLSDMLMGAISIAVMMWIWQYRFFDWGYGWKAMLACLIAQDFVYWYKHMAAHKIRWFWSAHVVHHSSEHYNLSTALRQPWNNHFTGFVLLSSPLVLLGFHPALVAFIGAVNLVYQFWIHTEAIGRMPRWFEFIFNTPSHHRVHHGTNPRYLDSNYGGILIIWDRMFGTFVEERDDDPVKYGVVTPIRTFNPVKIAFAELVQIFKDTFQPGITFKDRVFYLFAKPGYSHDGSRKNSLNIKADYVAQNPDQAGMPGLPKLPLAEAAE